MKKIYVSNLGLLLALISSFILCPYSEGKQSKTLPVNKEASILASWYGDAFAGKRTANGEIYDPHKMTAAHRTLRFGTMIKVCREEYQFRCAWLRINDRGPYIAGRDLDVSEAAAEKLGFRLMGLAYVRIVERIDP